MVALVVAAGTVARPAGGLGGLAGSPTTPAVIAGGQVLVLAALGYLCITALPALAAARGTLVKER